MSDEKKEVGNPFDEENFAKGGGLWDGRVVTVLGAKAVDRPLNLKDGSPYMRDGVQAHFKGLELEGIADDAEAPRREQYSAGSLLPSPDGDSFVNSDPEKAALPVVFYPSSAIAEFARSLKRAGFPTEKLYLGGGKLHLGGLVGAQFVMVAVTRKDKNGEPKINAKGYKEVRFYPEKFVGFKAGVAVSTAPAPSVLRERAIEMVTAVLTDNGGTLGRADLIRGLSKAFAKDGDVNKVVALITREDFYKDNPSFVREGTTVRLA